VADTRRQKGVARRGLGRGLDALLGSTGGAMTREEARDGELRELPLDRIQRGRYQPRTGMDAAALEDLANSIRAQGVVQPILVRPLPDERFEIIAGERRWRAGLAVIPAVVRRVPDAAALALALIENIQRENLNPLEEAGALNRLIDEFRMTHQEAADAVGRSRAAVSNLLRLLELDREVKLLLERGEIEMGHARALLSVPKDDQRRLARRVAARGLSVRETERLARRVLRPPRAARGPAERRDPDISRLEQDLAERLGASVSLRHHVKGHGTVTIRYHSLDELEGILTRINK
jgi:ParB family transcriptional regulator, chromosome partitioning protein